MLEHSPLVGSCALVEIGACVELCLECIVSWGLLIFPFSALILIVPRLIFHVCLDSWILWGYLFHAN